MDVIVTKWVGLKKEHSSATEHREELSVRYAQPFLDKAAKYSRLSSIRSRPQSLQSLALLQCTTSSEGGVSELSGNWGSVPASD